jgi:hypothetical protein
MKQEPNPNGFMTLVWGSLSDLSSGVAEFVSKVWDFRYRVSCGSKEAGDLILISVNVRMDCVVGIATRYGLEGPVINYRWGRDFPQPSRPTLGPTQPPIQCVSGLFPGGKTAGAWSWPPTPSSVEVKERVELYLYSSSGPSWPLIGWPLSLPLV